MNTYDMKCPVCGKINHQLYLDETDGWMECEHCGRITHFPGNNQRKQKEGTICRQSKRI